MCRTTYFVISWLKLDFWLILKASLIHKVHWSVGDSKPIVQKVVYASFGILGDEKGMLEDMYVAVQEMSNVSFKVPLSIELTVDLY